MKELQKAGVTVFVSAIILVAYMLYVTMPTRTSLPPPLDASEVGCLESVEITVLIDNNPDGSLRSPWGISLHVTAGNLSLLFDAGPDPGALKENCERLSVNLTDLDTAVISHEHGDHVNGLGYVAEMNENLTVYVPKNMSEPCKNWIGELGLSIVEVQDTCVISTGIAIVGELYGPPYEQALALNVRNLGLVVLVGCSHPGVEELVAKAVEDLGCEPYAVIGGFHLGGASSEVVADIAEALVEMGLKEIYPMHCSGEGIRTLLRQDYPDIYGDGKVGMKLIFDGSSELDS